MAVTQKTVWVASDGKEFNTQRMAENHDQDILYAEYRKAEDALKSGIDESSEFTVEWLWDHKNLVREYFEAREAYERY